MKESHHQNTVNSSSLAHQPFFSIIVTTYNRAHIIKRALDSLIAQTENDWEAIIVDDESIDDTYSRVLPYLNSHPKIKYLRIVHSGEAMSKNAGINSSTGKFVTFLDSDDEFSSSHLSSRKMILQNDPSVRFLHGGAKIIGNQYVPDRFDYKKIISLSDCVIGGTFFIERTVLFQLKGFRKIMLGTDANLFDRAIEAGVVMKKTDNPTYVYHHETEDSITNMLINGKNEFKGSYSK
jgi:glycosyltransferase involved in cell wall biosynthesis